MKLGQTLNKEQALVLAEQLKIRRMDNQELCIFCGFYLKDNQWNTKAEYIITSLETYGFTPYCDDGNCWRLLTKELLDEYEERRMIIVKRRKMAKNANRYTY